MSSCCANSHGIAGRKQRVRIYTYIHIYLSIYMCVYRSMCTSIWLSISIYRYRYRYRRPGFTPNLSVDLRVHRSGDRDICISIYIVTDV